MAAQTIAPAAYTTPRLSTVFFVIALFFLTVLTVVGILSFTTTLLPLAVQISVALGSVALGGTAAIIAIFLLDD